MCPCTPEILAEVKAEQNGCADQEMKTIVKSARTVIYAVEMEWNFWTDAVNIDVNAFNRFLKLKDKQLYLSFSPSLSHTHTQPSCVSLLHCIVVNNIPCCSLSQLLATTRRNNNLIDGDLTIC